MAIAVRAPLILLLFSKANSWFFLSQSVNFLKLVLFHCPFTVPVALLGNSHKLEPLNIRRQAPSSTARYVVTSRGTSVLSDVIYTKGDVCAI
ncbi:MAG: hypothetical protein OXU27_08685, partial [Candidatus Poribacteria bacterium]|nr:hypothetical protein [Candidatus Poribacteria bacterium]